MLILTIDYNQRSLVINRKVSSANSTFVNDNLFWVRGLNFRFDARKLETEIDVLWCMVLDTLYQGVTAAKLFQSFEEADIEAT